MRKREYIYGRFFQISIFKKKLCLKKFRYKETLDKRKIDTRRFDSSQMTFSNNDVKHKYKQI